MKKKPLSRLLTQLMFAGCLSTSISLPAQAGNLYQRYWQQVAPQFSQHFSQYRFRPVAADAASASRFRPGAVYSAAYRNAYQPVAAVNRYTPIIRPVYGQPLRSAQVPAFARQFAWSPAPNTVYRRGGSEHHYASEQNNAFETDQVDVPRFRTAPVSTQGLRFRSAERSAPFVSFSERVRQSMPEAMHQNMHQPMQQADNFSSAVSQPLVTVKPAIPVTRQLAMPVVEAPVMQPPVFSQPMMPMHPHQAVPQHQPVSQYQPAQQHMPQPFAQQGMPSMPMPQPMPQPRMQPVEPPVKIFMSSQPLPSADGYQFRPDERFIAPSEQGRPVEVKPFKPADPVHVSPTEVENVQLARAQFVPAADSPWNNYTFRPTDIVLQR